MSVDPARHPRRRWWQRREHSGRAAPAGFTERQIAALAHLGFRPGDPNYEMRPDETGDDDQRVAYIVTAVLREVFGIRNPDDLTAERF
ncbi:hypothetical protein [Nocardia sp. NPDC024068]|uniref:TY-Chap domain-containing protein n=1 Tax=Nocardia sp. NPDC024068 TaxID=3157197 RepID=UPI00340C7860